MVGQTPGAFRAFLARVMLIIGNALHREDSQERVSVWSVSRPQASIFFPLMYLGWSIVLTYFIADEAAGNTETANHQIIERTEAVLLRFGMMVLPIAATSMMASSATNSGVQLLEAVRRLIVTLANRIYNRLAQPIEAIGETRGINIGEARGEARGIARALDWAQRKANAESQGLPFDEPPPEAPPQQ